MGGIVDGHHSGTQLWFDRLNPETGEWQTLPDAPNKRDHGPCVIINSKLYFFGGRETGRHNGKDYDAFFGHTVTALDIYDFNDGTWSTHPEPLPIPNAAGGSAVIKKQVGLYWW